MLVTIYADYKSSATRRMYSASFRPDETAAVAQHVSMLVKGASVTVRSEREIHYVRRLFDAER